MSSPNKNKKYQKSPQAQRKFAFDLNKPIMTGYLGKQGELFGVTFKQTFFILYPGFLVYYSDKDTWRYDLQRGETLGSRLGAIKLLDGYVEKDPNSKGDKYLYTVHCPDPNNKKKEMTCSCQSNEERYQWVSKITSAIPKSKETAEKKEKQAEETIKTEPTSQEDDKDKSTSTENLQETDEVLGPQLNQHDSDNEIQLDIEIQEDNEIQQDSETPLVTSSASIEVRRKSEETTEEQPQLQREETVYIDDVKEVVINQCQESPKFSITVIDSSLLGTVSEDSSPEEDDGIQGTPPTSPVLSNNSTPPPDIVTSPDIVKESPPPPSVTITNEDDDERQPNSAGVTENTPHISGSTGSPVLDRRRPSGALPFIDKRGYLYKMGGKHKSWHLRYFVLQPGVFHYYKNEPKGKALGEVKLKNIKIMYPKTGEKKFSPYQFIVHTESSWNKRKDWVIAATTEKEMTDWIEAFKTAGGGHASLVNTSNGSSE